MSDCPVADCYWAERKDEEMGLIDPYYHECCGNCARHCKQGEEWVCGNVNSDYYSLETDYNDCCDEYEPRE